jgi:hypothetical protein
LPTPVPKPGVNAMINIFCDFPNLGQFWGPCNERWSYIFMDIWPILQEFGLLTGHSAYFVIIWYIFFPVLVCCTKKNLATLRCSRNRRTGEWWICFLRSKSLAVEYFRQNLSVKFSSPEMCLLISCFLPWDVRSPETSSSEIKKL